MMSFTVIVFMLLIAFQEGNCKETCRTKSCVETATRVLDSMNNTIDPCDDFFEFACRGWMNKNPIPPTGTSWDVLGIIRDDVMINFHEILEAPDKRGDGRPIKLARAMYRTCMDEESVERLGTKPLHDALKKVGLPLTMPSDEDAEYINIPRVVGKASRYYDINIFINSYIRQDGMDYTKNRLMMKQTSPLFDGLETYLRDPERFRTLLKAQRRYVKEIMWLAGAEKRSEGYTIEIMDFMTKIAKIMATMEDKLDTNYMSHDVTIDRLQEITDSRVDQWNWMTYLNSFFEQSDIVLRSDKDTVVVIDMKYVEDLVSLLRETSPGTIARFVSYTIWSTIGPKTTQEFRDLESEFKKKAYGITDLLQWFKCTTSTKTYFDLALTATYVEKHFSVQEKKKAMKMWNDVSSSFDEMLTEVRWMDDKTKAQAYEKIRAMRVFIGFPDWILNATSLEKYYEGIEVYEGRPLDTEVRYNLIEKRRKLNSLRQTPDRMRWITSPTSMSAYYSPIMNTVTIPAGMLHVPLYGNGVEALNYGGIGAIIGHEVTHGFDNEGSNFNAKGNFDRWMSQMSLKRYRENVRCMINQYSDYVVKQLGSDIRLNGVVSQGENIADNGGLREAFRAYKKLKERSEPQKSLPGLAKYTDEQLFFLGFAQMLCGSATDDQLKGSIAEEVHAPNRYRVIGTLQNSIDFANAWKCSSNSSMNPKRKCIVW